MEAKGTKQDLRRSMKASLSRMSLPEKKNRSRTLNERLQYVLNAMEGMTSAPLKAVLGFYPLSYEVDIRLILEQLHKEGRLYLPRIENSTLQVLYVENLNQLIPDEFQIPAPPKTWQVLHDWHPLNAVLVPGLAFSPDGNRLGHGKGYFDQLLGQVRSDVLSIGLCFDQQIVDNLPVEDHDIPLDFILTEQRLFQKKPRLSPSYKSHLEGNTYESN